MQLDEFEDCFSCAEGRKWLYIHGTWWCASFSGIGTCEITGLRL